MNLSIKRTLRHLKRINALLTFLHRVDWAWHRAADALEWLAVFDLLK